MSAPRPESGGKSPAEFHGKVEQLGQFAIDWLYQAQLWVQAGGFVALYDLTLEELHTVLVLDADGF